MKISSDKVKKYYFLLLFCKRPNIVLKQNTKFLVLLRQMVLVVLLIRVRPGKEENLIVHDILPTIHLVLTAHMFSWLHQMNKFQSYLIASR